MPAELTVFANLGGVGVALGIFYLMLKYFMKTLDERDTEFRDERKANKIDQVALVENFQKHVELCNDNFIKISRHNIKSNEHLTKTFEKLIDKIETIKK